MRGPQRFDWKSSTPDVSASLRGWWSTSFHSCKPLKRELGSQQRPSVFDESIYHNWLTSLTFRTMLFGPFFYVLDWFGLFLPGQCVCSRIQCGTLFQAVGPPNSVDSVNGIPYDSMNFEYIRGWGLETHMNVMMFASLRARTTWVMMRE